MKRPAAHRGRGATAAACGLLLGLLTVLAAVALGAGGHGWVTPFFLSAPLIFLYPLTLARAVLAGAPSAGLDAAILLVALLLDLLLAGSMLMTERDYALAALEADPALCAAWSALWLGWQALALATLRSRLRDCE